MFSADGVEVGRLDATLHNLREAIFDGVVIETRPGDYRFVDAPEVARCGEDSIELSIPARDVPTLPPRPGPSNEWVFDSRADLDARIAQMSLSVIALILGAMIGYRGPFRRIAERFPFGGGGLWNRWRSWKPRD